MSVLNMTLSASVMIIMIEILRALTMRRLPKNLFRIFWAAAALRLLVPFSLPFRFSAATGLMYLTACLAGTPSQTGLRSDGAAASGMPDTAAAGGGVGGAAGIFDSLRFSDLPGGKILLCIYLAGAAAAAVWFAANYIRSIRLFRESLPAEDAGCVRRMAEQLKIRRKIQVRESEFIRSPLTYGVFRPVILLPKGVSETVADHQMQYIFTHELVHIRRFDAVLKLLLTAAVCLHWFNPFVWIMYFLAGRDIELACDESVVRILGSRSRAGYASMLVNFAEYGKKSSAAAANFSRNALSERVISIMDRPSFTPARAAAAALLFAVTVSVSATSPQTSAVAGWLQDSASSHENVGSGADTLFSADLAVNPGAVQETAETPDSLSVGDYAGGDTGDGTAVSGWNRPAGNGAENPVIQNHASQAGTQDSAGNSTSGSSSGSQSAIPAPSSPGNLEGYDDAPPQDNAAGEGSQEAPLPASPGSLESYG